jgi:predicted transcriptional regulator
MSARCEAIGKYVLPVFRSHVAKELVNTYHFTQVDAAQKLGTTQAAISQYINSKRAFKGTQQFGDVLPKIKDTAKTTAKRLAKNEIIWDEVTRDFCKLCLTFSNAEVERMGEDYVI